jgi:hypothetical protein
MSPKDENCPFHLSNLTFAHFNNFLSTQTNPKAIKGEPDSLGVTLFNQANSALVHLLQMSKFEEKLIIFMKGMKRHVTSKKKMESSDANMIGKKD